MKLDRPGNQRRMVRYMGLPLLMFIFCFPRCSFGLLEGYQKTEQVSIAPVSWFKTDSDHLLMNTTIDVMKNHFSGLMVIKSLTNGGYRVVFITEVGLKIFDMEFVSGKPVKVYYFMDALNKKILIRTLSADLRLLLIQPQEDENPVLFDNPSGQKMARYKHKQKKDYYEISAMTGMPVQAYQVSGTSKKARIDYYSRDGLQIDSVNIIHYHVNLRIGMHLINENSQDAVK
jgi:hypothetical protein